MKDYGRALSENIAALRRKKGMTQEELASKLGLSFQAVSKWENLASSPDIALLPVLAEIFSVSVDALFGCDKPQTTLPWEDDETLRAVVFQGRRLLHQTPSLTDFQFIYHGEAMNVISSMDIQCENIEGDAKAGGDINCEDIEGNAQAGGDINCEDIEGGAQAGGDINCTNIEGSAAAGRDITCASVNGAVHAGGDINCASVRGDAQARGDITCADIAGDAKCEGDMTCSTVMGNAEVHGDIHYTK